jgi:pimeloyl-ACP methyl ester carboxylesterase
VYILNATRGAHEQPALDGSDVAFAVSPFAESPYSAQPEISVRAAKSLRAWQYQFGSEGYLSCFEGLDPSCQKTDWTLPIGGGPAFQVWARTHYPHAEHDACSEVSIAFRGTVGFNLADWISNADPVSGYFTDDYYRQLRRNIGAIVKKITNLDCYKSARHRPQIVSVGHSLGGGLAQFVALANNKSTGPRIAKVFAFDPSPVTGASLVDKDILSRNVRRLEIDRIYESGEVLDKIRKIAARFAPSSTFPPSSSPCGPLVRTVIYEAFRAPNSVELHNMASLAAQTVQLSYDGSVQQPFAVPSTQNCRTRYHPPATDEDDTPVPSANPAETVYAPDGSIVSAVRAKHLYGKLIAGIGSRWKRQFYASVNSGQQLEQGRSELLTLWPNEESNSRFPGYASEEPGALQKVAEFGATQAVVAGAGSHSARVLHKVITSPGHRAGRKTHVAHA